MYDISFKNMLVLGIPVTGLSFGVAYNSHVVSLDKIQCNMSTSRGTGMY